MSYIAFAARSAAHSTWATPTRDAHVSAITGWPRFEIEFDIEYEVRHRLTVEPHHEHRPHPCRIWLGRHRPDGTDAVAPPSESHAHVGGDLESHPDVAERLGKFKVLQGRLWSQDEQTRGVADSWGVAERARQEDQRLAQTHHAAQPPGPWRIALFGCKNQRGKGFPGQVVLFLKWPD